MGANDNYSDKGAIAFLASLKNTSEFNVTEPEDGTIYSMFDSQALAEPMTTTSREEFDAKLATTTAKIETSEAKVAAKLAEFDTSVKTGFAELRADFAKMQMDMHKNTVEIIKWGVGVALTMVLVTISVLTFVVKTSTDSSAPKNVTPPQAPSVSYAQPTPPAAAPPDEIRMAPASTAPPAAPK
jgi:hypothetical protein